MEESWLEKLKRLLTEYDPFIKKDWEYTDNHWYFVYIWWSAIYGKEIWMLKIISKEYWFIKRLVENDKIDIEKEIKNSELNWLHEHYLREDCLLMLLSISDEPIRFLISVLK